MCDTETMEVFMPEEGVVSMASYYVLSIDTCNEYTTNTVDARTFPWVLAATPIAF